jgi:hypothetical protein
MAGFRQPGDLGRYVAFNDPGQPGAGFSSYEEYLNAGNKPFNTSGILQPATLSGISSGLRRNDGSIVEGTTGNLPTTVNNQSMNRGPSTNSIFAMIPEQGPLGPGLVGGTTPQTGINLPGNRGTPMGGNFTLTGMAQQPVQQPLYDQNNIRLGDQRYGTPLGAPQATNSAPFLGRPVLSQTSQLSQLNQPTTQMPSSPVGQPTRPAEGLTLAGMAQQPVQQPIQQPMQNPLGGGLSSLNQQPQQMNGGIRSLLDSYIGNYINNYFKNALR